MAMNAKLTPKLSAFELWSLAFGGIVGWGAFVMPGNLFLPTAGPVGSAIAFAIAAGIMTVIALNFHFMMNRRPVAGGAFIYAQDAFGRTHGYICGWFLALAYLAIIPQNATALALISRNLLGSFLEVGPSYSLAGYDTYLTEILLTAAVLCLLMYLAVRSTKTLGVALAVFASCIVIGCAVIVICVATSPVAAQTSIGPAFNPEMPPLLGILGVLVVAPWAFVGFDAVTQMSEDISFSPSKAGAIMVASIVVGTLVYIGLNFSAIAVLPPGYADWHAYIADLPNLSGLEALPVFYAVSQTMGATGFAVLVFATVGATLSGVVAFTFAISRLLYAMAREEALPAWFGELHPRYGTPHQAILVVLLASLAMILLGRVVLGWIIDMSSIGATIAFLYTSAATFKLAKSEGKALWQLAGVFGAVVSVVFGLLLLIPIASINSTLALGSYVLLITWIVLGINFYTPTYPSSPIDIPELPDDFDE